MKLRITGVSAGLVLALSSPTSSAELYCLATSSVNWNVSPARMIHSSEDELGFTGWAEFWVNTETGEFRGRIVGSRAMYHDVGTYTILADGTEYRHDWVGQIDRGGFESLRIDLTRDPIVFMRADRDGFVETGNCVEAGGRKFIDGREITE